MPQMLVRHRVTDFASWKTAFDAHAATRKAAGCQGATVYQEEDAPNEVTILFTWDSLAHAHGFAASADLKDTMQRAGVAGAPEIHFLREQGRSAT